MGHQGPGSVYISIATFSGRELVAEEVLRSVTVQELPLLADGMIPVLVWRLRLFHNCSQLDPCSDVGQFVDASKDDEGAVVQNPRRLGATLRRHHAIATTTTSATATI